MMQTGDVEVQIKTDKRMIRKMKHRLFLKGYYHEINKEYHQNNYAVFTHFDKDESVLVFHYQNEDVKYSLNKKEHVNTSSRDEIISDVMKLLDMIMDKTKPEILSITVTENKPFIFKGA